MFFTITNNRYLAPEYLKTTTLMKAYFIIKKYPLKASDLILEQYIKQQYKTDLKNICIKLLLSLSYYTDNENNIILMFKDPNYDRLARLITYGNGSIPGSKILQIALSSHGGI